ncbi:TonB-dependent receptor [Aquimarina sp. MMG016]|uniref:TonB-dependent receptor domain-containing protein n=1 Tax=Aquimarina sp. MMG016 TaxID=2822690 RepID=UPI001B3A3858|nr:TonB-dependent receptor [Aquimarina sp. MMG016]MBQ4822595.1 TonB-dependent receptor [Aquimarina sp. MMG016]
MSILNAQTLNGKVVDPENNPVPYTNVILSDTNQKLVKAGITDQKGNFYLKNIQNNTYQLSISSLGFTTYTREISINGDNIDLGTITLKENTEALEEVKVTARKPIVEVEPDKTVFNVAETITSSGNNSLDLLRKAPGVRVDNNDNIIVEGKNGVLIYIDDRQSFLQGDDLTAFLQSLQADEIESIEIITQPSSRYDAAGNAGIINLRLKREKGLGTVGSFSNTLTYGDFLRNNAQIGITTKAKKWNFNANYSNFTGRSTGFINLYRIQGNNIFDARSASEYDVTNHNIRTSADYVINTKNTLGASINVSLRNAESRTNSRTPIIRRATQQIDSILLAPNSSENKSLNLNTNLNYRYKDTLGRSLMIDLNYGRYVRDRFNNQPNIYVTADGNILNENITAQDTPIDIDIYVGKADYEQKLGKGTLSLGSKLSFVKTDNTFDFFTNENGVSNLDESRSNNFIYDEMVTAGYVNYNFAVKKWKIQAGLRMENTHSKGDLTSSNQNNNKAVERDYTDWFPSGGITYQASQNNSLALIYSRRIQRPNYQALNPFEFQLDELSFRRGNPFLQPQYTNNIKLSHTYKYTLTTSLSYSYINDFFAQITEAEGESRNFINTRNVANQEIYNLSVSYPRKINEWWNIYVSAYLYYSNYKPTDPSFIPVDQTTHGGYAQSTFTLGKGFTFEISGWYSSPSIWGGTYNTESLGSLNVGLQKKWDNWTIKLAGNDILYTIPWRGRTQFGDLFIDGRGGSDSRTVQLYIGHSFGNKDVKTKKQRKSGLEDEQDRIDN